MGVIRMAQSSLDKKRISSNLVQLDTAYAPKINKPERNVKLST